MPHARGPLTCLASVMAEDNDFFTIRGSNRVGKQDWVGVMARLYRSDRLRVRSAPDEDASAQQILRRKEADIDNELQEYAWKLAQTLVAVNERPRVSYFSSRMAAHRGFRGTSFAQRLATKTQEYLDMLTKAAGDGFKPVGSAAWAQAYVEELKAGPEAEAAAAARKVDEMSGASGAAAGAAAGGASAGGSRDAAATAAALRAAREHKSGRGPPTERGTLLVVERVDDVLAPLLHGASYGEAVVDLADWTPGLPLVFQFRNVTRVASLDRRDRVWAKLQHLPLSRAQERLNTWMRVRKGDEAVQDQLKTKGDLQSLQRLAVAQQAKGAPEWDAQYVSHFALNNVLLASAATLGLPRGDRHELRDLIELQESMCIQQKVGMFG